MDSTLKDWIAIPDLLDDVIREHSEDHPDLPEGEHFGELREVVHHIVEANFVAANIILAALATRDTVYDWSWVIPNGEWKARMNYAHAPIAPALHALRALCEYYRVLIEGIPDAMTRSVQLLDSAGAKVYRKTVAEILLQERKHAEQHLGELEAG